MTKFITDIHVHFYNQGHLNQHYLNTPYQAPDPNLLKTHLDQLFDLSYVPYLLSNIHLSILPDSQSVFDSLTELNQLKAEDPKYQSIHMIGFIKADPGYATEDRLNFPGIKGVRIVLHNTKADELDTKSFSTLSWNKLYNRLIQRNQHLSIYATHPETVLKLLKVLPDELIVDIDHLGNAETDANDPIYLELLNEAKRRNNVYFKGPGYRTNINPLEVIPYLQKIIEIVGFNKLLLGATDAPHVGIDSRTNVSFRDSFPEIRDIMNYRQVLLNEITSLTNIPAIYFELINACNAYQIPLPSGLLVYSFNNKSCVMWQKSTTFEVDHDQMKANLYYPEQYELEETIFINCSGFTGLEHIHPQRFARALTTKGYLCFSFDYRGFGANESLSELGRVRLSAQIDEIVASAKYLREHFPNKSIILNGWGMAGGLVIKAAVELIKVGIKVAGILGLNGLYNSDSVQHSVRGEQNYAAFLQWFNHEKMKRQQKDPIDLDPFDIYPLAPKTRQYVDNVLRQEPSYTNLRKVDFEFAKQLLEFKVTDSDLDQLATNNVKIHFIHGSKNDIHPISQAEDIDRMAGSNSKLTQLPDCNHTDFMHDDDPRYLNIMTLIFNWTKQFTNVLSSNPHRLTSDNQTVTDITDRTDHDPSAFNVSFSNN